MNTSIVQLQTPLQGFALL